METRTERLLTITRRLVIMTAIVLSLIAALLTFTLMRGERLMTPWLVFGVGLLGGFVSIQQRLKRLRGEELCLLARSWFQVLLIPVYGGIFALVLYVAFLAQIVSGDIFPKFVIAPFTTPAPVRSDILNFLGHTSAASGEDFAKLLFWSFVAGFSERFVPQILQREEGDVEGAASAGDGEGVEQAHRADAVS